MRQWIARGVSLVAGLAVLVGCSTPPKTTSDRDVFGPLQDEAAKITANGGLASVGIGESRSMPLAVQKAETDARTKLTMTIETRVSALRKQFVESVGQGKSEEINELFSSATKQLADSVIAGTAPTQTKYETKDGQTRAFVLMVQNPKILSAALENAGQANKSMYTRFRASQGFKELDEEVKKYEEFKKQQGGM